MTAIASATHSHSGIPHALSHKKRHPATVNKTSQDFWAVDDADIEQEEDSVGGDEAEAKTPSIASRQLFLFANVYDLYARSVFGYRCNYYFNSSYFIGQLTDKCLFQGVLRI